MNKPEILKQRWYLLEQPWAHSSDAGTTILAGHIDPHIATFICDLQPIDEDDGCMDMATARQVAQHIVELHNHHIEDD